MKVSELLREFRDQAGVSSDTALRQRTQKHENIVSSLLDLGKDADLEPEYVQGFKQAFQKAEEAFAEKPTEGILGVLSPEDP